jgi:hypothetical protein
MNKLDYDGIFYYTITHWKEMCKKAEVWPHKEHCVPISIQIMRKFNISEMDASKIARSVSMLVHIGIVWKE